MKQKTVVCLILILIAGLFGFISCTSPGKPGEPEEPLRTWTERVVPGSMGHSYWTSIASSSDGTKLAAVASNNKNIFTSP